MHASQSQRGQDPESKERIREAMKVRERDSQVWDMVDNLVHPAFIYVFLQVALLSYLWDAPPLAGRHPLAPWPLAIYFAQFLGAWAVFYTTLLRDMRYRSPEGTLLLLASCIGVVAMFFVFPEPRNADGGGVSLYVGFQAGLGVTLWTTTFIRWRAAKKAAPEGAS